MNVLGFMLSLVISACLLSPSEIGKTVAEFQHAYTVELARLSLPQPPKE